MIIINVFVYLVCMFGHAHSCNGPRVRVGGNLEKSVLSRPVVSRIARLRDKHLDLTSRLSCPFPLLSWTTNSR